MPRRAPLAALAAAVALAAVLLAAPLHAQSPDLTDDGRRDELALRINRARREAGALPLARNAQLDAAAQAHSRDMAERDYLDHEAPDGSNPQQRAERAGYRVPPSSGWIVVEVISAISDDPQGPLDWWLNESPAVHGRVLRDRRWREMGVGYARGGRYGNYWTVLVACRPGVVPAVALDGVTHQHEERCGDPTALGPEVAGAQAAAVLSVRAPAILLADRELEVAWQSLPAPAATDWFGLYRPDDPDRSHLLWAYVSCGRQPTTPRPGGACRVVVPPDLPAGPYEVRLFGANSYERLGPPTTVVLNPPAPRAPQPEPWY